jgi:uncharacterized protein (TIGR03086 family)
MNDAKPVDDLERVGHAVEQLVGRIGSDQWQLATPCTEWNVRQLVNHMAAGNARFTAIARGEQQTPPTPGTQPPDLLGDDPAASFREMFARMLQAFRAPGFAEGRYPTPIGELPGAGVADMRIHELLVHGWDLARATGQPATVLPDDVAVRSLATMQRFMGDRPRTGGPFGPAQPAPDDAPAIDRYAAFLGRPL